ncbi:hypothetical protein [Microtetraspora glauca]|uniref:Uncharacterized protein n=1 Tax=Microtetraspora glauca TaxID=1996 RepID=A0ABV3GNY8_MICGL
MLQVALDTPDRFVVAYGRRLCDVYTRDDPAELARVRRTDGVAVRDLSYLLADICPSAAATMRAANERREREFQEWEDAERRKCAEAPRHRPLITPVAVVVRTEPIWTDYGDLEAYEPETAEGDPGGDLPYEDDVLSAGPGHLVVHTHPDVTLCVTTETYRRRPPVESRGGTTSSRRAIAAPVSWCSRTRWVVCRCRTSPSGARGTIAYGCTTRCAGPRAAKTTCSDC